MRIAASGQLMPYYHSKLGATPVQPDPVYFELAVTLPRPTSIREACDNITLLSEMKAIGQLDVVSADSLISDQRVVLNAMVDEAKLFSAQGGSPEQTIRIEGGLPPFPGTDVIMPDRDLNGHQLELTAVVNPQASAPGPVSLHHKRKVNLKDAALRRPLKLINYKSFCRAVFGFFGRDCGAPRKPIRGAVKAQTRPLHSGAKNAYQWPAKAV